MLIIFIMSEGVFYGMVTESAESRRSVIKCCMCNANLRCSKDDPDFCPVNVCFKCLINT